jgi:hypothetical protein
VRQQARRVDGQLDLIGAASSPPSPNRSRTRRGRRRRRAVGAVRLPGRLGDLIGQVGVGCPHRAQDLPRNLGGRPVSDALAEPEVGKYVVGIDAHLHQAVGVAHRRPQLGQPAGQRVRPGDSVGQIRLPLIDPRAVDRSSSIREPPRRHCRSLRRSPLSRRGPVCQEGRLLVQKYQDGALSDARSTGRTRLTPDSSDPAALL